MACPNGIPPAEIDYFSIDTYSQSVNYLKSVLPSQLQNVKVGIICGSGLGGLAATLEHPIKEIEYKEIPNFALSTVPGHAGKLVFGMLAGKVTVCMVGRKHMYEGHSLLRTVFPVRVMKLLGVENLIVTNAAGGLNPNFNVGDIMLISDHLSVAGLGGCNPLIGPNMEIFGPRFPATSQAYNFDLRMTALRCANESGISPYMREGIYCFVPGPTFESRAEARFLRQCGGDSVGMSTVPEVQTAVHCGIKVLGLSLITNNVAQGYGKSALELHRKETNIETSDRTSLEAEYPSSVTCPLYTDDEHAVATHDEVLATSDFRSKQMQAFIKSIVGKI